ncbi:MAG: hypothetical protein HYX21_01020 [Candidatus Yanofskybacteria bacterium]|nr:hypothetical protein [Candidatus Yanofskybacteria bacterium]
MTILWTVVAVIFTLYVLTTTTLLLTAKFKKNEKGNPVLDPDSWHFKLCHPILTRKHNSHTIIEHQNGFNLSLSICSYSADFFLMLWVSWPVLILWSITRTIVYAPFMTLFGYFPIADIDSMVWRDFPFAVNVGEIPLPEIKGHKIFPVYVVSPIIYSAGWLYFTEVTKMVSIWSFGVAIAIAVMIVSTKLTKTNQKEVSLVREWLLAKKSKVCLKLELASAQENTNKN